MSATPSRIAFVLQPYRQAVSSDSGISTRHGNLARRDTEPVESFFDNVADAQTMATARQALLGREATFIQSAVRGLDEALGLDLDGDTIPTLRDVDLLRGIDRLGLLASAAFDFDKQQAVLPTWG